MTGLEYFFPKRPHARANARPSGRSAPFPAVTNSVAFTSCFASASIMAWLRACGERRGVAERCGPSSNVKAMVWAAAVVARHAAITKNIVARVCCMTRLGGILKVINSSFALFVRLKHLRFLIAKGNYD